MKLKKGIEFEEATMHIDKIIELEEGEGSDSGVRYALSCMTSPEKYEFGKELLITSRDKYIEFINKIFEEKIRSDKY